MSSTIASVRRNTFSGLGTRDPSSAMTPTANAMSVAIGIPQPSTPSPPRLNTTYRPAGTIIPPRAAIAGIAARLGSASSPSTNSRLISSPTTKKKIAIRPSFTQCSNDSSRWKSPNSISSRSRCQKSAMSFPQPVLASTSALIVAISSTTPPAVSTWMNSRTGRPMRRASVRSPSIQVRPSLYPRHPGSRSDVVGVLFGESFKLNSVCISVLTHSARSDDTAHRFGPDAGRIHGVPAEFTACRTAVPSNVEERMGDRCLRCRLGFRAVRRGSAGDQRGCDDRHD